MILSLLIPSLAILISLIAVFLVYGAISSAKSSLSTDINMISLELKAINVDVQSIKTEINHINLTHYDALKKKLDIVNLDTSSLKAKVESNDNSLQNFYRKWAVRLGKLAKEDVSEEEPENPGLPDIIYPEKQPAQKPLQVPAGKWVKKVG